MYLKFLNTITKIKNFWFKLSDKIRFLLVGGFNAAVSYLIFSVICLLIGEGYYQLSLAAAWAISSVVSFFTQRYLVFTVQGNLLKQYIKCCTTWVFSYLTNAVLLEVLVKKLSTNVYLAQIIATFMAAVVTYILFKTFAFRRKA